MFSINQYQVPNIDFLCGVRKAQSTISMLLLCGIYVLLALTLLDFFARIIGTLSSYI